jgi:hypothetical protein
MEDDHPEAFLLGAIEAEASIPSGWTSARLRDSKQFPDRTEHLSEHDRGYQTPQLGLSHSVPRKPVPSKLLSSPAVSEFKTSYSQTSGKHKDGHHSTILHNWWLEAIYCVLVVGSLIAIVATIYPYDGHPIPQWPYRLSINTLIAIYTTILKATMLMITAEGLSQLKWVWFSRYRPLQDLTRYDMASRGPWGSLRLLWTLRGRDAVSSIGALVTVAALVIDPFTQQVVQVYSCPMADPKAQASIPRTNVYSKLGEHIDAGFDTLRPGMQSAIYAGVYNPETITIPFDCATGNCTFEDHYSSVGYCSSCFDLTPDLKVITTTGHFGSGNETEAYTIFNTTLPSGLSSVYSADCIGSCDGGPENQTLFVMSIANNGVQMILGDTSPLDNYLKDCSVYNLQSNDSWTCAKPGYGAAQCDLYPCVRKYKANVVGGKLKEHVVSVSSRNDWGSILSTSMETTEAISMVSVDCLSDPERDFLLKQGYNITNDTTWLPYNASFSPYYGTPSRTLESNGTWVNDTLVSRNCIYEYYPQSYNDVSYFLQINFNASIITDGDVFGGPSIAQAFYNAGNINLASVQSTFENIAQSMTVHMRNAGNASYSAPALGQVINQETCVQVRWAWLTYPAAVVLLLVIFFAAMIWETGRDVHRVHGWKSSPLALMYHGLNQDVQDRHGYGVLVQNSEMEQNARRMQVRLRPTEKGWLFEEETQMI